MKTRIFNIISAALCLLMGATSCMAGSNSDNKTNNTDMKTDNKKLVVYFSHTGENYNVGYITEGNTRIIADMIADAAGADRFEIVPETAYPEDYNECIDLAKRELQSDARPAVKGDIAIEDYDVIFIGYPQWWGEPPMCVYTFIESHDWTGKTVIPFVTHEGSGMGGTDRKIDAACKGADVLVGKGLAVQGKVAQQNRDSARRSVDSWLGNLGYVKH
ncbi:MAG: flavodoxin [Duncaniella sp.]|nr:flavodoxin [Duncaniella sp.]